MRTNTILRTAVRSLYQMQQQRIESGNRLTAAFRVKLGLDPSQQEEESEQASSILNQLRAEYERITDGVKQVTRKIKIESPLITNIAELTLIEAYELQLQAEKAHAKAITFLLEAEPIWTDYLIDIHGIGPLMAGVLVAEVDIHKCNSVSALYAYCGLDVVQTLDEATGEIKKEGRSRRKHHLVPKQYTSRSGETIDTVGISFNDFLKTKMVGVLGDSFIKTNSPYKAVYVNYKVRIENMPEHKDKTKLHRHRMAKRYMIKIFLFELWQRWRELEGLSVRPSYAEEKLGIVHSQPRIVA